MSNNDYTKHEITMCICSYALFLKEMLMFRLHSSQDFLTKYVISLILHQTAIMCKSTHTYSLEFLYSNITTNHTTAVQVTLKVNFNQLYDLYAMKKNVLSTYQVALAGGCSSGKGINATDSAAGGCGMFDVWFRLADGERGTVEDIAAGGSSNNSEVAVALAADEINAAGGWGRSATA